jgi:serine protease Do
MRYLGVVIVALCHGMIALCGNAAAQISDESLIGFYNGLDTPMRMHLQRALIWVDAYKGIADGQMTGRTISAIKSYQQSKGLQPSGFLSTPQFELLLRDSGTMEQATGYRVLRDERTSIGVGVPTKLIARTVPTKFGTQYLSADERLDMATLVRPAAERSLRDMYTQLLKSHSGEISYKTYNDIFFVIAGGNGNKHFYVRFHAEGPLIKGFAISYPADLAPVMGRVATIMSSDFQPDANNLSVAQARANPEAYRARASSNAYASLAPSPQPASPIPAVPPMGGPSVAIKPSSISSGTAFLVTDSGMFLTNAHVVDDCTSIGMGLLGNVRLVAIDKQNDLALLKTDVPVTAKPVTFSAVTPRLGEEVIALGYPLQSVLKNGLNVTKGDVSSMAGLGNDSRSFQMTAAVQPGNSGGPLFDREGHVIGVVTAKLDAVKMVEKTGDIPQSVNFAIRLEMVKMFMDRNNVAMRQAPRTDTKTEVHEIVAAAQDAVQQIACVK